jgi:hypothetical protein
MIHLFVVFMLIALDLVATILMERVNHAGVGWYICHSVATVAREHPPPEGPRAPTIHHGSSLHSLQRWPPSEEFQFLLLINLCTESCSSKSAAFQWKKPWKIMQEKSLIEDAVMILVKRNKSTWFKVACRVNPSISLISFAG